MTQPTDHVQKADVAADLRSITTCIPGRVCGGSRIFKFAADEIERLRQDIRESDTYHELLRDRDLLLARYEALQKAAEGMAEAIDGHVCDPAELARGDCSCCIAYDSYRALRKAEGDKP